MTQAVPRTATEIRGRLAYAINFNDWLLSKEGVQPTVQAVREGLRQWPAGATERKTRLFDDRAIGIALDRLTAHIILD